MITKHILTIEDEYYSEEIAYEVREQRPLNPFKYADTIQFATVDGEVHDSLFKIQAVVMLDKFARLENLPGIKNLVMLVLQRVY